MGPFVQSSENSPQHTRQVAAKGPENDGKLPPFLHQVFEQLEEGGQDPVVEASVLSFHSQLSVSLQGTQSQEEPMGAVSEHQGRRSTTNTQLLRAHKQRLTPATGPACQRTPI